MNKTKRRIFEESMKLFADKGYDSTSIEEITSVVGVAKGTFYYHFQTKVDMFNFLIEEGMKLLKNSIEIKTRNLISSIEKIKAVILIQTKVSKKYESFIRLILSQMWGTDDRNKRCKKCVEDYIEELERLVKEGIDNGEILRGDSKLIAYFIYSVMCSPLLNESEITQTIPKLYEKYSSNILAFLM